MPDFSALSAVLGAGLPATFTFLYQRLEHLLDRHGAPETALAAPVPLSGELSLPLTADQNELATRQENLETLRDVLDSYRRDPARIDAADPALLRLLGRLRGTLEEVYGQRLTFAGEKGREPSGPYARQRIGTVHGEAVAIDADTVSGRVDADQDITTIEEGGRAIGIRVRDLKGPPSSSR
ncbi:hypothetical protein [Streptomyces sp. NBC_00859]|uniref:hypothetical protein n=1 Tax=Streptomyces sp. NBC_00859 TaxID=2903682 RepID=UPI003866A540|nr:hypothetical protein OG584_00105 [Streptomyces sp. NBC_00859]WSZ86776.1 hypothetical protein OG584_35035 [Streptomyces sp. NBC_00859]